MPASGGAPRRLTEGSWSDAAPSVSRDGRRIYFSSDRTHRREIYRMTIDGRDVEVVTTGGGDSPHETYDGQHVEFVRPAGGGRGIGPLWVAPVAGGDARRLPVSSGGSFAVGLEGIYVSPLDTASAVSVCDPVTGAVRKIPDLSAGNQLSSVSPDGLTVLHTSFREPQSDLMIVNRFR